MVKAGYKQTEIGVIPDDWEVDKLGNFSDIIIGLTYKPSNVKDFGTLVLRSSNIQNNKLSFENNVYVDMELPERVIVRENDILICVRNGSKQLIGKCALINEKAKNSAFGAFMSILRTSINQTYTLYQFQSYIIQKQIEEVMGATINQITNKNLSNFIIPIPPKEEQIAIANALSDVDALITSLEKLIAKKESIKTATMQQLLTGKKRLNGFTGEWEKKSLGDICEVVSGGTPSTLISRYWNGNINWYTPTEIGLQKYISESNRKITLEGLQNSSAKILPIGTLLLTSRAGIGDVSILMSEGCTNQGFQSLITKKNNNYEFVYYLVATLTNKFLEKASGSTFLEISPNQVKSIDIEIPSTLQEQQAIAKILSDMDNEIEALKTKLSKTKAMKDGMMSELLSGQTRFKTQ